MSSYESKTENLLILMDILIKGELLSLKQAAERFNCSERTVTRWLNYLRRRGHQIEYSFTQQKFLLVKRKRRKKRGYEK